MDELPAVVVVGAQWGDEGKGKVTDYLAQTADVIVRCQGGNNAGHTVVVEGREYRLHLIPSGIIYPGKTCVLANGMVIDLRGLVSEIGQLRQYGHDVGGLKVSDRAHLVMPYHHRLDVLEEERRGSFQLGTTRRGIGPAYADKAARDGFRVGDLLEPEYFRQRLRWVVREKNLLLERIYGAEGFDPDHLYEEYMRYAEEIADFICDTSTLINAALDAGQRVLFEGAQGAMLDLDHGTYPYVTSSHPVAGGACVGAGVGPTRIDRVLGVVKAYTSRVGGGPFPTEIKGSLGDRLRDRGGEYGTTTGRPRRCGWLDAVALRHAVLVSGITDLAITKLDTLAGFDPIRVCVAYRHGERLQQSFPSRLSVLERCQPVYEELPGWTEEPVASTFDSLPPAVRRFLERVEELTGIPVRMVSFGRERDKTLCLSDLFATPAAKSPLGATPEMVYTNRRTERE